MKVNESHREYARSHWKTKRRKELIDDLARQGLTRCQANTCIRNVLLKLGEYNGCYWGKFNNYKGNQKPGKWRCKGHTPLKVKEKDKKRLHFSGRPRMKKAV